MDSVMLLDLSEPSVYILPRSMEHNRSGDAPNIGPDDTLSCYWTIYDLL